MPITGAVHVDAALTNLSIAVPGQKFIAEEVFPVVNVKKESDKYWVHGQEDLMEIDDLRQMGDPAKEIKFGFTDDSYLCEERALRILVPDRLIENSDPAIQPKITATKMLNNLIRLNYERRVVALLNAGLTLSSTPANNWNVDAATIEADVDYAINDATGPDGVRSNIGTSPNAIVMSENVARAISRQQDIRETLKYTHDDLLWKGHIMDSPFMGLKPIVAPGMYNTATEGQTQSLAEIWGDEVFVLVITESPSLMCLSAGLTFRKQPWIVKRWRDDERDGEWVQNSVIQDEKIAHTEAGHILNDVLS